MSRAAHGAPACAAGGVGACVAAIAVAWAAGCGSSSGTGARAADGGAGRDAGAEAAPSTTGVGVVAFTESADGGGSFFAGFSEENDGGSPTACTFVDAGGCVTASCPPGDGGTPNADAASSPAPSAGILEVTGGAFGAGVPIAQDRAGTYIYTTPRAVFAPGDTLGVAASGATIPPFAKETLVAPPLMHLTAPQASGGKITVTTSQPLTVTWAGGRAGDSAVLVATAFFTSGSLASMTCTWDASLGTATVPSAALRPLAAANAVGSGMAWYALAKRSFTDGPIAITFSAYATQESLAAFQ